MHASRIAFFCVGRGHKTIERRAVARAARTRRRLGAARFPLTGRDVMMAGVAEGPLVGRILAEVEEWWIDSDFTDDAFSLAERLKAVVQATAF